MVDFSDKNELHDPGKSLAKVLSHESDEEYASRLENADPEQLSWFGMNHLTAIGKHDAAARLWNECKSEALDEFDTGFRAAGVIDSYASPAQRARFIVLRDAFREDWQPRGATELALVDQLAQMHHMYEKWLACHIVRIDMENFRDSRINDAAKSEGRWVAPRQSEAEATREAADMADRFQKGFLRTVRALRDLRRYAQSVVIQNAGQVSLANQQVNIFPNG